MEALSDDDFERVSDIDLSEDESDREATNHGTPSSTPPSARHIRASDRKTIPCVYSDCQKTFNRKARLEEHLRSHTNSRIFKCQFPDCDKDFLRETHLKHHVKSAHSDIRDYRCTWEGCDKSFATGTRLRRHLQAHEGREKFRCRGYENCNQTFRKHETLKRHILEAHEHMRPFPCHDTDLKTGQQCDKAFDTAEKLRAHQRVKHDNTRFSCTECQTLQAQTINNTGAYAIQDHDVYFATYSDLQAHIAEYHPPTCPYCPTSFTTSKELTRHLELQHGIVDLNAPKTEIFRCAYPGCDRSFTKKGNLTVHVKTVHEKKKEFVCGETEIVLSEALLPDPPAEVFGCGRAFGTKASLEDHVRSAHLGMTSLQVERRNKRKAEHQRANEDDGLEPTPRRIRKDKGSKKSSVLHDLLGGSVRHQPQQPYVPLDPALENPYADADVMPAYAPASTHRDIKVESDDDDDDDDDFNQLSGSMTLLGGRLYHYDDQYEYVREACPPGLTPAPDDGHESTGLGGSATYSRVRKGTSSNLDDEPFFGGFEHEPEPMSRQVSSAVPVLGMSF